MTSLAYFIVLFAVIQLVVALVNLLFAQSPKPVANNFKGLVSVLIPARNEESNIANLLKDLQKQDYQHIEIIVFNDLSTDKTEEIVKQMAKDDDRIKLINSNGLENGWLGKNFACHSLSKHAKGEYLLFLDADVRIKGGIILNSVAWAQKYKLGLLSIFPKQKMLGFGERLAVPNMNYVLLSLLPLALVYKSRFSSVAAANGQFMLFRTAKYVETHPHEKFKNSKVEDIDIARYFKKSAIPIACFVGNETVECRMYPSLNEAIDGFSKNVISFFGGSFITAIVFWVITTLGFLVVIKGLSALLVCTYFFAVFVTSISISIVSKQNILLNLILHIPQRFVLGLFIYKSMVYKSKKQFEWKGRRLA
jgi:glycosyltransferase involved in cell wall biosynthesis